MIRAVFQQILGSIGAVLFVACMGMLLSRPTELVALFPEAIQIIEEQLEDPTVRVVLDAGHGGIDGGAPGPGGLVEKELAMEVVRKVKAGLEAMDMENLEVVLTRRSNAEYLTLHQRVAMTNRYPKVFFVSVHFNGSKHRSASGTETYFASPKPQIIQNQIRRRLRLDDEIPLTDTRGERFAQVIQEHLVSSIGLRDRGIRNNPRLVLPREVIGPSVLVECAFLTNASDAAKVRSSQFRDRVASGITNGILAYLEETEMDPYAGVITDLSDSPNEP